MVASFLPTYGVFSLICVGCRRRFLSSTQGGRGSTRAP
jgi:hypothetical protein